MFAKRKKIATCILTLAVALGTGHVMQYGIAPESHVESPAPRPSAARPGRGLRVMSASAASPTSFFPEPELEQGTLAFPSAPVFLDDDATLPRAALGGAQLPADAVVAPPDDAALDLNAFGLPCDVTLTAAAAPGAMIAVDLRAGCDGGKSAKVEHAGVIFSEPIDGVGQLQVSIPALSRDGRVSVTIGDQIYETSVDVPDAGEFDRVALIWSGEPEIVLHAVEIGAEYGQGQRGFSLTPGGDGVSLVSLGDSERALGMYAQVLSAPAGDISRASTVRLAVRTQVTPFNCGRRISAQALRSREAVHQDVTPINISMPGCGSVGDILVLKNVLQDLKIARN